MTMQFLNNTRYFADKNEVFSTRIWELVKAGPKSYNLFDYEGIRHKDAPADRGPAEVKVEVETLYRKKQKDEWVTIEDFLKQPGVTPFGKVRYTMRYNVTITVKVNDRYFDKWSIGNVKYWFTKKCTDMMDGMLGGNLMDYDQMATDIEVNLPEAAFDGEDINKDYYQNLQASWLLLVDKHVRAENAAQYDKLAAILDNMNI